MFPPTSETFGKLSASDGADLLGCCNAIDCCRTSVRDIFVCSNIVTENKRIVLPISTIGEVAKRLGNVTAIVVV